MKWKKIFEAWDIEERPSPKVRITENWISYKELGWNPAIHKDVLSGLEHDAEVVREALKKWEQEFGKKKRQSEPERTVTARDGTIVTL